MAGYFELIDGPNDGYRIALRDGDGDILAMSTTFATKQSAVRGISTLREIAGTALIKDRSHGRWTPSLERQAHRLHLLHQPAWRKHEVRSAAGRL
ncbi:YegP family protein [Arthrobacter sp. efr-133-TYG-118]|uniref:YegP family protein n=1 Tax=Arthrobacter sp. efr-133-TYG-118 TaxID=3040279 RepID=UPI00254BACFA|nr:YegP family protein [Arthrobacter sp. efr-133-TYG-118]